MDITQKEALMTFIPVIHTSISESEPMRMWLNALAQANGGRMLLSPIEPKATVRSSA